MMPSNHLILCHPPLLLPSIFPSIRVFSNELTLCIRWLKYQSFSISPSNEYSGLISFRIGLVGSPCCPRDSQDSSPTPQFKSFNSLSLRFLYSPTFTSIHELLGLSFFFFPFLALMKNTAENICVQALYRYLSVDLLRHIINLV